MVITIPLVNSNEMIEDAEENGSVLEKSASQQYPSFQPSSSSSSSNFDQPNEEFGSRKNNPFESHQDDGSDYSTQQTHQYHTSTNNDQTNNNNNNGDSSMQSPYREYGPSIYNMHTMNGDDSQQSYGQNDGGSDSKQETGSFTPVSLSVDNAFRKYFPNENDGLFSQQQQSQGQSIDGYSNQQV